MSETVTRIPCDSCGRLVTMERMPEDWPFDWWTHEREGKPRSCASWSGVDDDETGAE